MWQALPVMAVVRVTVVPIIVLESQQYKCHWALLDGKCCRNWPRGSSVEQQATNAVLLLVSALGVVSERSKLYPDPRCQKSLASLAQLGCGRQTVLLWLLRLTVM